MLADKRKEILTKISNRDKFEDYKKHTIKRIDGNPRKAGIKTIQELRAEEDIDSQLEDIDTTLDDTNIPSILE
jgi:hypothetical protein